MCRCRRDYLGANEPHAVGIVVWWRLQLFKMTADGASREKNLTSRRDRSGGKYRLENHTRRNQIRDDPSFATIYRKYGSFKGSGDRLGRTSVELDARSAVGRTQEPRSETSSPMAFRMTTRRRSRLNEWRNPSVRMKLFVPGR